MSKAERTIYIRDHQLAVGSTRTSHAFGEAIVATARDEVTLIRGKRPGDLSEHLIAAIVPADRCSACNRLSRTMRDKGQGVLWCGRTACLEAIRELLGQR